MSNNIQEQIGDYQKYVEGAGVHSKLGKFYRKQIQQLEQDLAYYSQFRSYGDFEPKTVTELDWSQELESLSAVHEALQNGAHLHAFRSGGGLRVVNITLDEKDVGYGESPFIEDALVLANRDVQAGVRPYKEVYGKEYPHFFTGSANPSSRLDEWILGGNTLDASYGGGLNWCRTKGLATS